MTTETKHTPGPWRAKQYGKYGEWKVLQADELRHHICTDIRGLDGMDEANARLIAAAPTLLEALQELLTYLGDWDDPTHETCVKARAAIARATK